MLGMSPGGSNVGKLIRNRQKLFFFSPAYFFAMRKGYAERRQVAAKAQDEYKKFEVGKDPLEKEDEIAVIQPLGGDEGKQYLKLLRRLLKEKRRAGANGQPEAAAVQFRIASYEADQLHGRVQKEFARDFVMWLHGRGKEKDHQKSWMGRASLLDDPEVRAYCHMFTVKRTEYILKLTRLGNRRPMGINEHFLFFKYVVRNEPLDQISFHADSKLLLEETWDAIQTDPDTQHPVRDAPKHHEVPPFDRRDRAVQREADRNEEQVSIIASDDEGDYGPGGGRGRGGPRGEGGDTDEEMQDAPGAEPPEPPPQRGPRRSNRAGRYQGDYSERGGRRRANNDPADQEQVEPMDVDDDGGPADNGIDEDAIGAAVANALQPMLQALVSQNRPPPPPPPPASVPVMDFPAPNISVNVPQQQMPPEVADAINRTRDYGNLQAQIERERGERNAQSAAHEKQVRELYEKLLAKSKGPGVSQDDKAELDKVKGELERARGREDESKRTLAALEKARSEYMVQMGEQHKALMENLNNRDKARAQTDAQIANALSAIQQQLGNLKGNTANGQPASVDLGPLTSQISDLIGKIEPIAVRDPAQIPNLQTARQQQLEAQVIDLMGKNKSLEGQMKSLGEFMDQRDKDNAKRNERVNQTLVKAFNEAVSKIQAGQRGSALPPTSTVVQNMPALSAEQMTSLIGSMNTLTAALGRASLHGKNVPTEAGPSEAQIRQLIADQTKDSRDLINKLTADLAQSNADCVDAANQLNALRTRLQAAEAAAAAGGQTNAKLGKFVASLQAQLQSQEAHFQKLVAQVRAEAAQAREDAKAADKDARYQIERLENELSMAQADVENMTEDLKDQMRLRDAAMTPPTNPAAATASAPPEAASAPPKSAPPKEKEEVKTDEEDASPEPKRKGKSKSKPGMEIKVRENISEAEVKAAVGGLEEEKEPEKNEAGKRTKDKIAAVMRERITPEEVKDAVETTEGQFLDKLAADFNEDVAQGKKIDYEPYFQKITVLRDTVSFPLKVPADFRSTATPEQMMVLIKTIGAQISENKFDLLQGNKRNKTKNEKVVQ